MQSNSRTRLGVLACALCAIALAPALPACSGKKRTRAPQAPLDITGRLLVSLEDGDLPPSAYLDADISVRDPAASDTLTLIRLPLPAPGSRGEARAEFSQVLVSNSALASPTALTISPDGGYALVASRVGQARPGDVSAQDLPADNRLTLIDIRQWPARVVSTISLCEQPSSVAFDPSGTRVAVICRSGGELAVIAVGRAGFGSSFRVALAPLLGESADPVHASWSPDGRTLAVALGSAGGVGFLRINHGDVSAGRIEALGDPVQVGRFMRQCVWTPDGRFVVVSDTGWESEASGLVVLDPPGAVHVVDAGASQLVHSAELTPGPHAIALSPGGGRLAVVSLRRADLADDDESLRLGGVVSLFSLDSSGRLALLESARCGSLPHDVTWDTGGGNVLVADFETGRTEVFEARRGGRPALRFAGLRVDTGYGPHAVRVAP